MESSLAIVLAGTWAGDADEVDLPKVLFPVLGRPMVHYVVDALEMAGVKKAVVVVGYRAGDVKQELQSRKNCDFALQEQRLGTGHAVMMARQFLEGHQGPVVVVAGDSPLLQASSLEKRGL
ncbi:MAG: NTP transferase domain-containing protein [Pirellulales bacterium]